MTRIVRILAILALCLVWSSPALAATVKGGAGTAAGAFAVVLVLGAALGTGALTLLDWAKRQDPGGKTAPIVELLNQTNEVLDDQLWKEGNLPTGHRTTIRAGLPTVYWRLINQAVATSKSRTVQVDEASGIMEAWSEVDCALAKLGGDVAGVRMSEAQAFIEAMNQEQAQTLFYGNSSLAPEEYNGLAVRYAAISGATNASNVITGSGSGSDNTSIWLIVWGENTVFGVFPQGSKAGLEHHDYGEVTVEATAGMGSGTRLRAFQDRFVWNAGLVVKDWRYAVRICNIDISNLVAESSAADLQKLMIKAMHRIPHLSMGRPVFYCNRTVKQMLHIQVRTDVKAGGGLSYENFAGKRILTFDGIPIRTVDALLETEATIT